MPVLDISRLENIHPCGDKLTARCPACSAQGFDSQGNHLVVYRDHRFGCVMHPGDRKHRQAIWSVLGGTSVANFDSKALPARRPSPLSFAALPSLTEPAERELRELAAVRQLPTIEGLKLAVLAKQLFCAKMRDKEEYVTVWVLKDSSGHNAQARRLDGKPWQNLRGAKAKTIQGSTAAWPIGAADIGERSRVVLCEGGPDTLAAWTIVHQLGQEKEAMPICMAGAGLSIHAEALPIFRGKGVIVCPHSDEKGELAARRWSDQLLVAGAQWVKIKVSRPHKDLNQLVSATKTQSDL